MDIICARCGKHLNSIEAAREHRCKDISHNEHFQFRPSKKSKISPEEWDRLISLINAKDTPSEKSAIKSVKEATKDRRRRGLKTLVPDWAIALILIFALTLIGFAISRFTKTEIPLYLLFGFSVIYSVEKWLRYYTRANKNLGKMYRLLINLSLLSLLGLTIWTGIQLFSRQFFSNSIVGSLIFAAELILFIWMWRVVSRNSWRWPSMKLTVFSLICLFLIFSFAGVQPMAKYKDEAIDKVTAFFHEGNKEAEISSEQNINEQDVMIEENSETSGQSFINQPVDVVDNLWDASVEDYANKFNQYRQSKGLRPLEFTDDLNRIAELRLKELYTDYSHNSAGNYNKHLAENIAMSTGFLSNSDALRMWQNSSGHNANMLDSGYKYTGYAIGNGYAVQVFTEYPTINGEPQLPPGWYWVD